MELTNEQRKYFGIELVDSSWERVEIPTNSRYLELPDRPTVLFFEGDVIRKAIWPHENGGFTETSEKLKTQDNRSMIAPITSRGKAKRLNVSNLSACKAYGTYLDFSIKDDGYAKVRIGNYDTQKTYYSTSRCGTLIKADEFIEKWISETTERDLADLEVFNSEKRKHCKYKEGDFFRFKYDRRHYGYGRILMDVQKWIKDGGEFWDILMGKALCVSIYHVVTDNPDMTIGELDKLSSCPSEYIMDNLLYYGDFEIIGNKPLPVNIDYPIMYGRSISFLNRDKICLCIGKMYKELPLEGHVNPKDTYMNNGIGFELDVNMEIVNACIEAGSNAPYWEYNSAFEYKRDLRNPAYKMEYEEVKKLFL